ncbi:membrane-spanning 4-domains subfamily A member 12 [Salmo salar]|uniref:Membrane-spanning 4-domains subfamily A member 12-like n=1 Tax=Salmo salar TaxID=8030 RepID=A0A1S3SJ90_SALSA|nr:membrane-spanning 4-domains subfamily A member 12-like [Salmo salar]XP_014064412.1 membrane-spanning 4-domains subfamily A member 12-like [Salmo salar]XP_014064413.1 membrane-spanning 4-domains subfamily A member 12-like [Salmo salar]|eukprot:XP_014064410.1 PREDICTED: membrane-spanning 4-domains subfamily A member 12-like [Salmo salar]
MAVSVARDLSVSVTTDINADKLTDRRQALRENIQKGEPKALGVSQVMIGVMVMSYSLPLLSTEFTEVVTFGVPWWSGLSFIAAGVVAIVMEKHSSMKLLGVCMVVTLVAILVSLLALIFYFIDLHNNPETTCNHSLTPETHYIQVYECDHQHYATMFSYGVKSSLLLFTIIQITISSTLSYILYMERRRYSLYSSLNQGVLSTPILVPAPDFN